MYYKYLHSKGHTIALINCKLHPEHLLCGAAYFVSGLPKKMNLYSLNGDKVCSIAVPDAVINNPTYTRLLSPSNDIKIEVIDNAESLGKS